MGTSFARHVHSHFSGRGDESDASAATHVDDVQAAVSFTSQCQCPLNGLEFGVNRARIKIVAHGSLASRYEFPGEIAGYRFALRMDCNDFVQCRSAFHAFLQRALIRASKIVDAAVTHEGFKPNNAPVSQFVQFVEISWD